MKSNTLISTIHAYITKHNLIPESSKIILGFSGGPDSMFLLHVLADLHKAGTISLVTAHLNHEWRSDADQDTQFCRKVAAALAVPFVSAKISELNITIKHNGSREQHAREMRRYFFAQVKKEHNADLIALAHHAQDQVETFFIRLIRGATLTGLTAMRPKNGLYIRPLLEINKNDMVHYLDQHNIDYLQDPTNNSQQFLRNRIRHTVIPALQSCDSRFEKNVHTAIARLQESENLINHITQNRFQEVTTSKNNTTCIDIDKFLQVERALQYRIVMHWLQHEQVSFCPTQKFLDEIIRFLKQPGSKSHHIHHAWRITKKKRWAHIEKSPV